MKKERESIIKSGKTKKSSSVKKKNGEKTKKNQTSSAKNEEKRTFDVNIRMVKLTKECRKRLKKVKDGLWGNVADAIECGNWFIPVKNHNYTHIKESFEKGTKDFFNLDQDVCVEDFFTDIICYDNHR